MSHFFVRKWDILGYLPYPLPRSNLQAHFSPMSHPNSHIGTSKMGHSPLPNCLSARCLQPTNLLRARVKSPKTRTNPNEHTRFESSHLSCRHHGSRAERQSVPPGLRPIRTCA